MVIKYPKFKFCLTSCGRPDLLRQTVSSFKNNCMDKHLISEYHLFDDHSREEDLASFSKDFPEFIIHRNKKRGQPYSINRVWELCKDDMWYFHCEDDWAFVKKDNFISQMFNIAHINNKVRNVTLRYWQGVTVMQDGLKYHLHNFKLIKDAPCFKPEDIWEFCKITDNQWFSYSFNPGIIHIPTMQECGKIVEEYHPDGRGWDKDHAEVFMNKGYKRANLPNVYIAHIGQDKSVYKFNRRPDEK